MQPHWLTTYLLANKGSTGIYIRSLYIAVRVHIYIANRNRSKGGFDRTPRTPPGYGPVLYMVRPSPARRYIHSTATRDIFRRPHEETSALSGTTCIIIAESAKQIALVSEPVSRKAKWLQTLIAILVML